MSSAESDRPSLQNLKPIAQAKAPDTEAIALSPSHSN